MSCEFDIEELLDCINSERLEIQIAGLNGAKKALDRIIHAAVAGLTVTSNKAIYADRLSLLGAAAVPDLEMLYASALEEETKTTVAILLLHLGSRRGLSDVVGALHPENPNRFLAASKLANAGITDASDAILGLLEKIVFVESLGPEKAPEITSLASALRKLGVEVPQNIKDRLSAGTSKFIRESIE